MGPSSAPVREPAPGGPEGSRDQDIDALKRALKRLEMQKAQEKLSGVLEDVNRDILQKQLQDVDKQIAVKKGELHGLEAKAQSLRAKLNIQGGRPAASSPYNKVPPSPMPKTPQGRVDDLEKKLDLLQKELEELRRSLKRPPAAYPAPAGGGRPNVPGSTPVPPPTDTSDAGRFPTPAESLPVPPAVTPPATGTGPGR